MNKGILHEIPEALITEYEENGVVCVREQFDSDWCIRMRNAYENSMKYKLGRHREFNNEADGYDQS